MVVNRFTYSWLLFRLACTALLRPKQVQKAFAVERELIHPQPCKEVLRAVWVLKLHGAEEVANDLLKAIK
jgi:hypothetical protein